MRYNIQFVLVVVEQGCRACVNCEVRKCEVVNCEVECEVFMRGACKLRVRKVRGVSRVTMKAGDGETPCLLHNRCICMVLVYEKILMLSSP